MKYFSTSNPNMAISFRDAVINGVAEDGGLYLPADIPLLPAAFYRNMADMSINDIAYVVLSALIGDELSSEFLKDLIAKTLTFTIPVNQLGKSNLYAAELFHGTTGSAKDLSVRFMAQFFELFFSDITEKNKINLIAPVSDDYGVALADAFSMSDKFRLIIIHPKGTLSVAERNSLSKYGNNIVPIEVRGSFADCQTIARTAQLDKSLGNGIKVVSANSVNISALLPLVIQYFYIYAKMVENGADFDKIVIAVPTGNLANMTALLLASKMGLPIKRIIEASSINPDFIPINKPRVDVLRETSKIPVSSVIIDESDFDKTKSMLSDIYEYNVDRYSCLGAAALIKDIKQDEFGAFLSTFNPVKQNRKPELSWHCDSISPTYNAFKRIISGY